MTRTERGMRWVGVAAVGILLHGFVSGCTKVLKKPPPAEPAAASSTTAATTSAAAETGRSPETADAAPVEEAGDLAIAPVETPIEPTLRVQEIVLAEQSGQPALVVHLSRPADDIRHFTLERPNRIVVDFAGPLPARTRTQTYEVGAAGVTRVRIADHQGRLRLVADVAGTMPSYEIEQSERWVRALLGADRGPVEERVVYRAPDVVPSVLPESEASIHTAAIEPPATVAVAQADVPASIDPATEAALDEELPAFAMAARDTRSSGRRGSGRTRPAERTVTSVNGGTVTAPPPPAELREFTGQRISLDFKDADIQNVLRILADVSGLNIITTDDVQGKLTMRLVNVPWDEALSSILRAKGLDMVRDGNIARVSTVERLKEERDAQRAADEAQKQVEPLAVRYIKVNYAKADKVLVDKVTEVLTERGSATWDERTNTIVVRDIARGIVDAEELVSQFDTQTPQVLIEASIVEATERFARDLGIQWGYSYKAGPGTGNNTGQNFPGIIDAGGIGGGSESLPATALPFLVDFPAAISGGNGSAFDLLLGSLDGSSTLAARLSALESENLGKIISRPRVVTLNNVPANIEALRILRVRIPSQGTVISTGAGGVAGGSAVATEQIKTGIILKVTPQVSSDGYVFLDVFAKSSTLEAQTVDNIPIEVSRQAESHVLVKNGETFVLGGIFRDEIADNERGVPYLLNIPVLGWAFKNKIDTDDRQELLVFVTPRALQPRGTENMASLPSAQELWQNRTTAP